MPLGEPQHALALEHIVRHRAHSCGAMGGSAGEAEGLVEQGQGDEIVAGDRECREGGIEMMAREPLQQRCG